MDHGSGLPQNSVQAILQARDGYLWLTTFDGLVRFDGVRFTVFNRANTPGIKTNRFTALYEDREGVLWIGSEHGVLTRYDNGKFESFSLDMGRGRTTVSSRSTSDRRMPRLC